MDNLLIKNAHVVLPHGIQPNTDVLVIDGKISAIGSADDFPMGTPIIDGKNKYLFAGFIDVHVHGGGGSDFMDATVDAFETTVKTHLQHGTTTIVPTAMSASKEDIIAFISAYKDFKKSSPYANLCKGLHLEGPYFSGANAQSSGAQPTNILRYPDADEMDEILSAAGEDIIRWDAAPELPKSDIFAKKMAKNNILCAVGHSDATAEETFKGFQNGFSHITHFYNAVSSHRKREQKVYAGIVEATYLDDNVTVELIGDGCHIAKEDFMLAMKIKGVDKVSVITDAMRLAGTGLLSGKLGSLKSGTDCIVDDGVAKLSDLSSFAGSICTMDRALKVLCNDFRFSAAEVSVMMSLAPAKLIGCQNEKGSIAVGKDADFVITDNGFNLNSVIVGGKPVV